MPVFGQDAADRALAAQPLLPLKPGDVAQAGRPQQNGFTRVFNLPPVPSARQAFHGVEYIGLLIEFAACLLQGALGCGQCGPQGFCLGDIAHRHHDAFAGDTRHAAGRHLPRQHRPARLTNDRSALQRHAGTCHRAQLLDDAHALHQVKHIQCIGAGATHRAQPRHAPRRCIGSDQHQAHTLQPKLHQREGQHLKKSLQTRLCGGR